MSGRPPHAMAPPAGGGATYAPGGGGNRGADDGGGFGFGGGELNSGMVPGPRAVTFTPSAMAATGRGGGAMAGPSPRAREEYDAIKQDRHLVEVRRGARVCGCVKRQGSFVTGGRERAGRCDEFCLTSDAQPPTRRAGIARPPPPNSPHVTAGTHSLELPRSPSHPLLAWPRLALPLD